MIDRVGQHRVDAEPDPTGQVVDLGRLGRIAEGDHQGTTVDLDGHGAERDAHSTGQRVGGLGLGVKADRSTAGSWASWDSVPTTTLGRARPRLTSR